MQLLNWHRKALQGCLANPEDISTIVFAFEQLVEEGTGSCLRIDWAYEDKARFLRWNYDSSFKSGMIQASLPSGNFEHPLHIEPIQPAMSLSEAMFFA